MLQSVGAVAMEASVLAEAAEPSSSLEAADSELKRRSSKTLDSRPLLRLSAGSPDQEARLSQIRSKSPADGQELACTADIVFTYSTRDDTCADEAAEDDEAWYTSMFSRLTAGGEALAALSSRILSGKEASRHEASEDSGRGSKRPSRFTGRSTDGGSRRGPAARRAAEAERRRTRRDVAMRRMRAVGLSLMEQETKDTRHVMVKVTAPRERLEREAERHSIA